MAATPAAGQPDAQALRQRAERFWAARLAEDWGTVYEFEEPLRRKKFTRAEFIAGCKELQAEPFKVHEYTFGRVQIEGQFGWIEVDQAVSMRKFAGIAPNKNCIWEKWRVTDAQWYPVRPSLRPNYPMAPAKRDSAAEGRLRKRFDLTWEARKDHDWARLYALTDPRDHELVDLETLSAGLERSSTLGCEVQWVEVVANMDRGRVYVFYQMKINDPNMRKAAPRWGNVFESWIRYQGEWYLDLVPTPKAPPAGPPAPKESTE